MKILFYIFTSLLFSNKSFTQEIQPAKRVKVFCGKIKTIEMISSLDYSAKRIEIKSSKRGRYSSNLEIRKVPLIEKVIRAVENNPSYSWGNRKYDQYEYIDRESDDKLMTCVYADFYSYDSDNIFYQMTTFKKILVWKNGKRIL